jgi:hypothetical protein
MRLNRWIQLPCLLLACGFFIINAAIVYDEGSGDLSNSGLSPTGVNVSLGSNQVLGTTGRVTATDRDYFTITVAPGLQLNAIMVLPGTTAGGTAFIGLQAGGQVTLPTNAASAVGLLGWWHYGASDVNTDILPQMAIPSEGSSGFSTPLGSGTYSFWIQDFNAGTFGYGFDLIVAETPEPATYGAVLAGLGMILFLRNRHAR